MADLTKRFFLYSIIILNLSCTKNKIEIQSYILRDRVVVADSVFMKKALYVAFSIAKKQDNMMVKGELLNNNEIIAMASSKTFNEKNGNLVFDLPYQIPSGLYTIKIDVLTDKGDLIAKGSINVKREDLKRFFSPKAEASVSTLEEIHYQGELEENEPTKDELSTGYIIFARSPLEYVFQESKPKKSEVIKDLSIRVVRNEFEPITFSLYPLRDLGEVKITITDLKSIKAAIYKDKIKIGYVDSVEEAIGLPDEKFQKMPTLIRPGNQIKVEAGKSQNFYLTIRVDENVVPGEYEGNIIISPQNGKAKSLPLKITVVPITLTDIPKVDYFMLMTYEFTELTMPWSKEEKEKIYNSALNILKDYKGHGMTTLNFHSPFVYIANEDGSPNLEDIFAGLRAAKEAGFTRPIIWYMGHLIQTSKPRHPGNIIGFDDEVYLSRLKYLVKTISEYSRKINGPEVIFLPIDEADDDYQDYQGKRQNITPLLLKAIKESGGKTMLTTSKYDQFGQPDYIASGEFNKKELSAARSNGSKYWMYNNDVTTKCNNPAYARYIYGYYTWMNNIDGMSSWTFQNTQNASGLPEKADIAGRDIYLAYPDPKGPLATLKWEAVREGIDDHKLIYQLIRRIAELKSKGMDASKYEKFLNEIREKKGMPGCQSVDNQEWNPTLFQQSREAVISMILDADRAAQNIMN